MNREIRSKLSQMENRLLAAPVRRIFGSATWARDVPLDAGVYVIWSRRSGRPAYVGQTGCLRERMSDAGRSVNHTFRRKVATLLNLPTGHEAGLSLAISKRYDISFIPVPFGRAELEEYLRLRWRKTIVNGPAKRLLRGLQYRWITPSNPRRARPEG